MAIFKQPMKETVVAIPRPRNDDESLPAYSPPTTEYIDNLIMRMRAANANADKASRQFNAYAARADAMAKREADRARTPESRALIMRRARAGDPNLADADGRYRFWATEASRLALAIQAELSVQKWLS